MIAQIFYLAPIFAAHPELELHVICTRTFDTDWRRFVEHFGLARSNEPSSAKDGGVSTIRSQSSRTGTSSKAKKVQERINSSSFFSKHAQDYVRRCLFPEDWALIRLLGCSA